MDPREMETLVQRLVQNPHDQETINLAHQAGQSDPKSYATLLEKVGTATSDPAFACHWLTEAANVWSTTLGDAHRAARALMIAIDRDPTQATPADRLAELYREKGDLKALAALLERRARALSQLAAHDPDLRGQIAVLHEELGQLWQNPPLDQPKKAIDNYRRAVEFDPRSQYSIYALRELHKAAGQWADAIPYFALEQALVDDPERKIALFQDEGDVRKNALDFAGSAAAFRRARELEGGRDATLKQQLGSVVLERSQVGQRVPQEELREAAGLFIELAEEYPGEHGLSYSLCALELMPEHDRAVQLAMFYAEQLSRIAEVAPRAAAYLKANPEGALVNEARKLISESMAAGGDDALLDALSPAPNADDTAKVEALIEVAQALMRKARKNDAAAKYREVLAIEAGNAEAVGFLEPFLRQSRKYTDLRDILLAAGSDANAELEQRQSWLREVAGLCETQLRDADGAIVALKELLALDADDEPALSQLKRLLEKQERWDELTLMLANEAEQTIDVETRISLEKAQAVLHEQKRKDPVAAGEAWSRIAALATGDEAAISNAVRFFEQGERADLALRVIAESVAAVSEDTLRAPLLKKLAELRDAGGESLSAGEAYAEAGSLLKSGALWASAEQCFVAAQSWDQAATAANERAQLTEGPAEKAAVLATEAGYLTRAGDDSSSVLRLEQATELDPQVDSYAADLEQRYVGAERNQDLADFLVRRADRLQEKAHRSALRKRAAQLQREVLGNPDAARQTLLRLLEDGDDLEALQTLTDDAEQRAEFKEALDLLERLEKATPEPAAQVAVLMRQASVVADGLDDLRKAIAIYERVLKDFDPQFDEALSKIADLYQRLDEPRGVAVALERRLTVLQDPTEKLKVAENLARLYEETLADAPAAVRALDLMRELDPDDLDVVSRLASLCEKLEDWPRVAKHMAELLEFEGDEEEVSRMTRRLAEVLHEKVKKSDEALAVLMQVADAGDEACREEYARLGDQLGWKGIVATKLVEWYVGMPVTPARNASLRGAFERFVEVGREADAAGVAKELARTRSADPEIADQLEKLSVKLKDLDALGIAHDLMVQPLTGASRAEEMVRQAEVLAETGVEAGQAVSHGEQALTSVPPSDVEPLLARLAKLTDSPSRMIEIYERQVTRSKAPSDKLAALGRAASVAARLSSYDKSRAFFDLALGGPLQEGTLNALVAVAQAADAEQNSDKLRRTLADALANGGQGSRDGGRTRGILLGRAAQLAYGELKDTELAFTWLGDAIVSHVDDDPLDALERLADEVAEPRRAEAVLTRALEEVFDGPLVRKLLARRAALRREKLSDAPGAAADLKRLHDLSPADTAVMDQLSVLYVELQDYRGMVQLYEDQILRGKDPAARAELARKVAKLWENELSDPREAADAWRRVLRMKAGDSEAVEGLDRAKTNMLKRTSELPSEPKAPAPQSVDPSEPAAAEPAAAEPSSAEPSSAEPSAAEASSAEPSAAVMPEPEVAPAAAPAKPGKPGKKSKGGATRVAPPSAIPEATEQKDAEADAQAKADEVSEGGPAPAVDAAVGDIPSDRVASDPEPTPTADKSEADAVDELLAAPSAASEPGSAPTESEASSETPVQAEAEAEAEAEADAKAEADEVAEGGPAAAAEPPSEQAEHVSEAQPLPAALATDLVFDNAPSQVPPPLAPPSRSRPTPPPLPPSAIPAQSLGLNELNEAIKNRDAEDPGHGSSPGGRPPPKPERRVAPPPPPSVRLPAPPPRRSAPTGARPAPPPASEAGRPLPPPVASRPEPPAPIDEEDHEDDETELTVDDDELIDDKL